MMALSLWRVLAVALIAGWAGLSCGERVVAPRAAEAGQPFNAFVQPVRQPPQSTQQLVAVGEEGASIGSGDVVRVEYSVQASTGHTGQAGIEQTPSTPKGREVPGFEPSRPVSPLEIIAGSGELHHGLEQAVLGMKAGQKRIIRVPAEKSFGAYDPNLIVKMPCVRELPRVMRMRSGDHARMFPAPPAIGDTLDLVPYFGAKVMEVSDQEITFEFLAVDGQTFDEPFGATQITVSGDVIRIVLTPRTGAPFVFKERQGRITQTDGTMFTVDLNHPLAGQPVQVEFEILSVVKTDAIGGELAWIEDHDLGIEAALQQNKPVFLMLYADWCSWCHKMMAETLRDPRIKVLKDKFIWVKVDSDKEKAYKEAYQQNGFPLVVVLNSKGEVVKKIDGYRDAAGLRRELEGVL